MSIAYHFTLRSTNGYVNYDTINAECMIYDLNKSLLSNDNPSTI